MVTFDASSLILAWQEYQRDIFPPLWLWLGEQFNSGEFQVSQIAFDEVVNKCPDCCSFLDAHNVTKIALSSDMLMEALSMQHLLGIANSNFHPKGVGENDLLIIATARISGFSLITEEGTQLNLPNVKARYKIPAVCNEVAVPCERFVDLVNRSGQVFG